MTDAHLRISVGFGLVLDPGQEVEVREEYARNSMICRLARERMLKIRQEPGPLPDNAAPSRFNRNEPV